MNHDHNIVVQNMRCFHWRMRTRYPVVSCIVVHWSVMGPMPHVLVLFAIVVRCKVEL